MRKQRTLGLAVVMAVMLSLVIASSALAADPISRSGSPFMPVELVADINDQPAVFQVTDVATDPDGDETLSLAGTDYPCGYQDSTHFNYYPWDVGGQETCTVLVTDGTSYASVMINITTTAGPPPDNEQPIVNITSPANGDTVSTNSVTLSYTVTDNLDPAPSCVQEIGGVPFTGATVTLAEGPNTITVNCTDAAGNTGSATVNVTYTPPPVGPVEIFVGDATVTEVDPNQGTVSAVFQVTLSRSTITDITLHYGTFWIPFVLGQALPGSDYVMTVGNLVIPAGQTSGQISVTVKADNKREANEIFFLLSFSCNTGVIQDDHVAVGTIVNDD